MSLTVEEKAAERQTHEGQLKPLHRNLSSTSLESLKEIKERLSAFTQLAPNALSKVESACYFPIRPGRLPVVYRRSFVPLKVPPERRLQTAAVAIWALLMPISVVLFFLLWYATYNTRYTPHDTLFSSFPPLWPLILGYMIWIQVDTSPISGRRYSPRLRRMKCWKYFADYYPPS